MSDKTLCLFCDCDRESRKVEKGKDFICGSCVALLMALSQDKLQAAYDTAIAKGRMRKASAIETFLTGEGIEHGESSTQRSISVGRGVDDGGRIGESARVPGQHRETASLRRTNTVLQDR